MGINLNTVLGNSRHIMQVNTAGSVDNGKSTLIGRLLFDCGGLPKDVIEKIAKKSSASGTSNGSLNLAFFTDGLKAEQARGITIDVARHYVTRDKVDLIIADTPGHQEFTRNMLTGTSGSKATLILVDATKGIVKQNRRHAYIASLMGVEQIIVLINKMDLVNFSHDKFKSLTEEFDQLISQLGDKPPIYIPISALQGDNVVDKSASMPWYNGDSVISTLEKLKPDDNLAHQEMRFIVQWIDNISKSDTNRREIIGTVTSGSLAEGDQVIALPSEHITKTSKIHGLNGPLEKASFPSNARILLEDSSNISRGSILAHPRTAPTLGDRIRAKICWMQEDFLLQGKKYFLQLGSKIVLATISNINHQIDIENYEEVESKGYLELNDIAEVEITTSESLPWELFKKNKATGKFILIDKESRTTAAAGIVLST